MVLCLQYLYFTITLQAHMIYRLSFLGGGCYNEEQVLSLAGASCHNYHFCRDKSFVFVATKIVIAKVLSRQIFFVAQT